MRLKARVDNNQNEIVDTLRDIPGVTVDLDHNDILCGYQGINYWIELKNPNAVSKKTGKIINSRKKKSQKKLEKEWTGQYLICSTLDEILNEMGINNGMRKMQR